MHSAVQHDLDLAQTLDAVNSAERIETDEEKRMIKAVSDEMKSSQQEAAVTELLAGEEPKTGMLSSINCIIKSSVINIFKCFLKFIYIIFFRCSVLLWHL